MNVFIQSFMGIKSKVKGMGGVNILLTYWGHVILRLPIDFLVN